MSHDNDFYEGKLNEADELSDERILAVSRLHHASSIASIVTFFIVFFLVALIAVIPGIRPSFSETENRELKKFPSLSFKVLASGEFFDGINLWYSDTFPFRDTLVGINSYLRGAIDTGNVELHGEVEKPDVIPDVQSNEDTPIVEPPKIETPSEPAVEQLKAIVIVDNAAYEYYSFNQNVSDAYCAYINYAAKSLKDKANVYDMIVPTSMGVTAPKDVVAGISTSDQDKAIGYMFSRMSSDVKKVNVYNTLLSHKDEYIYFRTDHHWTALGAYYAYKDFMSSSGGKAASLSQFTERKFEGFLGTFYSASNKSPKLGNTPDTIYAYEPRHNSMTLYYDDGTVKETTIIANGDTIGTSSKYMSFIHGDKPLAILKNPNINDGSSCIVVKESFGNAFVPYLTENYGTVYVVDYRHFSKIDNRTLPQLVEAWGAQDVVFLNNVSATRNDGLVGSLGNFIGYQSAQ